MNKFCLENIVMEENSSYTYQYEKEKERNPEKLLKIIFAVVIVALAVFAIVLGIAKGVKDTPAETTTEAPETIEITTAAPELKYKPGQYAVNADGHSLVFRKDHSKDGDAILEIADKTELAILDVFYDENAESEDYEYWGQTEYKGHTGWVAMAYLEKRYSEGVVTPSDITTENSAESTSAEAAGTTQAGEITTAAVIGTTSAEGTSSAESTTAAQSKYKPGNFVVSTGGSGLRFKKTPGRDGEVILTVPDGTTVTVTEIVEIEDSDEVYRYWGKISYLGHTGYMSMAYLK